MPTFATLDVAVLVTYLVVIVGVGALFARRSRDPAQFTVAGRALPGWAVGLSMFGSYISSISFLANPGSAFKGNWNAFVFSLATPLAAAAAVRWFVPFYRRSGTVSAYEHLEQRFGAWARTYAVVCFLLTQMARMGTIVYLLALAVAPLIGWPVATIIWLTGGLMTLYTLLGGIRAVVWTGVLQSLILILGPIICLVVLLTQIPGGLSGVLHVAAAHDKFSLGSLGPSLSDATLWVVLLYGLVINLGNFGVDQSYVQRYIAARDDRAAAHSIWITACLYVPSAATFFFIGTALFALHTLRPDAFPADIAAQPDKVFPYFIAHGLPVGLSGLVVAAIFAASMDSNLNSMATLTLGDLYKRYFRPRAGDRESMLVLYAATLGWGALGTAAALAMIRVETALKVWWEWAGIFSGGTLGLFLLGLLARRTRSGAALAAVVGGVAVILWMSLSPKPGWPVAWTSWRSPCHTYLITVFGTATILLVGWLVGRLLARTRSATIAESRPTAQSD